MATKLVIENAACFSSVVGELFGQMNGADGRWVLSDEDKILKISDNIHIVINPFLLDVNGKKIQNKLLGVFQQEVVGSEDYIDLQELKSNIYTFIEKLIDRIDYPLKYIEDIGIEEIVKMLGVKICDLEGNVLSQIIDYVKIFSRLVGVSLFIFINLESYLTEQEVNALLLFGEL